MGMGMVKKPQSPKASLRADPLNFSALSRGSANFPTRCPFITTQVSLYHKVLITTGYQEHEK